MPDATQTEMRKVTVLLPRDLVRRAMEATGQGLTPTIRKGLEELTIADAYGKIRALRGKVKLDLDLAELREDRD